MKLINAKPSPYGRKVAIAMIEKGIPFETQWDHPWQDETIVRDLNPLEQLPILIADDGTTVYESDFILDWLEFRYPVPSLLPDDGAGRIEMLRLRMLAAAVIAAFAGALFETKRADPSTAWIGRQCRKITGGLGEIQRVVRGRQFAVGDRLTQADIALGCIIGLFEFVSADFSVNIPEFRWRETHPDLVPYIERLEARPSFRATQPQPFGEMPFDRLMAR